MKVSYTVKVSFWLDDEKTHLQVGDVVEIDDSEETEYDGAILCNWLVRQDIP